ncbi:MFS transporter [Streptomyces sp. SudanB66_2053]|uniref:MFS transporter n=1 Tax=Streptomyces sp. SudanB66_2053 TaxID=3035277 RepID=UPI003F543A15
MTHALRLPGAVVAVAAAGQPPAPWPSGPASPRAAVAVALEDRGGIGVLLNFAFYGLIFVFSLFFQHVRDCSPLVAGLAFLPMTAAVMTANLACGPLVGRFGARTVLITGNTVAALGYLAIVPVVGSGAYAQMTVQFVVAGFGIGLVVPSMANTMLGPVDPANAGIASGVLNASRQLGGPIGGAVMGLLVGEAASGQFPSGLRAALLSAVAALAVSAALSVVGLRTPRASAEASPTATTPPPRAVDARRRPASEGSRPLPYRYGVRAPSKLGSPPYGMRQRPVSSGRTCGFLHVSVPTGSSGRHSRSSRWPIWPSSSPRSRSSRWWPLSPRG